MNLQMALIGLKFIMSSSATKVVKDVIRNNLSQPENFVTATQYKVGTIAIGALAGYATNQHFDRSVEEGIKIYQKAKEKAQEAESNKEASA